MDVRGLLAAAWLLLGGTAGCAAPTGDEGAHVEAPVREEPLEISVDALDVVHGALRLFATMVDGAAAVSVRLGGTCDHREVGGGVSTPATLVWALGDDDVAEAIRCGLVVRACARDRGRRVDRVAELAVQVTAGSGEDGDDADGPRIEDVGTTDEGVRLVFSHASRGGRLHALGSLLAAELPDPDDTTAAGEDRGQYVVPRIEFARSVLGGRLLALDGRSFAASISVGGRWIE